jgi:hypothetical protein
MCSEKNNKQSSKISSNNNSNLINMKIAVPVTKENQIDSYFGHCES